MNVNIMEDRGVTSLDPDALRLGKIATNCDRETVSDKIPGEVNVLILGSSTATSTDYGLHAYI